MGCMVNNSMEVNQQSQGIVIEITMNRWMTIPQYGYVIQLLTTKKQIPSSHGCILQKTTIAMDNIHVWITFPKKLVGLDSGNRFLVIFGIGMFQGIHFFCTPSWPHDATMLAVALEFTKISSQMCPGSMERSKSPWPWAIQNDPWAPGG